jgi:Ca2+/H+ antiporter, TMEM165/GDT1 family
MRRRKIFIIPLIIVGVAVFVFVGGEVVMRLWNWLLPGLFGWRMITFWQGVGLLALCRILFGGFGGGRSHRPGFTRRRMAARWEKMTPEERERVRQEYMGRCGWAPPPADVKPGV